MKMKKGKVFVFSAPSGGGKTTVVRAIIKRLSSFAFSISATTRPPRAHEVDGVHYHFLSKEAFFQKIENGEFLEYEEVYPDRFYGTLKSEINNITVKGNNAIFDVDVQGGITIKKYYKDEAVSFFLKPPRPEVLLERLQKRNTESEEEIARRYAKAKKELTFADQFDHIIINDILEETIDEVENIIKQQLELV